ncbi:winged helix-turn-helix domain-containing protein [Sphingomonadaceae bacterium OTU29THOMA1]|nr:winged helix-turn-helix domain-containing protein [Sphingomonadaceae bacterium OTU29THOMA1]
MSNAYRFLNFELDPLRRTVTRDGSVVALGSRAFDLLTVLVEAGGELVGKQELLARVWPDVTVEETSLRVNVAALRRALEDGSDGIRLIANVPGRGYAFVAQVQRPDQTSSRPSPAVVQAGNRRTLPGSMVHIVGREDLIQTVVDQQPRRRFITLAGPGGIGKTTIALAAARQLAAAHTDGTVFVDLATVTEADFVPRTFAAAFDLAVNHETAIEDIVDALAGLNLLVVLDSCEHVVDAAASLVEELLRFVPGMNVLATSREPLRIEGEWVQRIPPLAVPEHTGSLTAADALRYPAIQLFVERADESIGGFDLQDSDAPQVAEICRRLDGIALAIELAAGRLNSIGLNDLAAGIDDRFRLLRQGRRTAVPRQQTLRAMLDWSYDALPAQERELLMELAAFSGTFSLRAGLGIADPETAEDAADRLADLVVKSLVVANVTAGDVSYRLLDTTREYAREKLKESQCAGAVARRHAKQVLTVFESHALGGTDVGTLPAGDARPWYVDDLRSALRWSFAEDGDASLGIEITLGAVPFWSQQSLLDEAAHWTSRALDAAAALPSRDRRRTMQLHAAVGGLRMYSSVRMGQALDAWEDALAVASEIGDVDYQYRALRALWADAVNRGQFTRAMEYAQRFSIVAEKTDGPERILALRMTGTTKHWLGDHDEAEAAIERMLAGYHIASPRDDIERYQFDQRISARLVRGRVLALRGRIESALADVAENVKDALALDHTLTLCNVLTQSACPIALLAGDREATERYVGLLLERTQSRHLDTWNSYAECFAAQHEMKYGDVAAGLRRLEPAMETLRACDFHHYRTSFLRVLADGYLANGRPDAALDAIEEALSFCRMTGEGWLLPDLQRARGAIRGHLGAGFEDMSIDFRAALELAQVQGALTWELRAASALAGIMMDVGDTGDAAALLSATIRKMPEGLDRADGMAAGALLASLQTAKPNKN